MVFSAYCKTSEWIRLVVREQLIHKITIKMSSPYGLFTILLE